MIIKKFESFIPTYDTSNTTGCSTCPFCQGGGEEYDNTYACINNDIGFVNVQVTDSNGDKVDFMPNGCPLKNTINEGAARKKAVEKPVALKDYKSRRLRSELPTCDRCEKNPGTYPHTCPLAQEIHGDDSLCNCCDECCQECANDV